MSFENKPNQTGEMDAVLRRCEAGYFITRSDWTPLTITYETPELAWAAVPVAKPSAPPTEERWCMSCECLTPKGIQSCACQCHGNPLAPSAPPEDKPIFAYSLAITDADRQRAQQRTLDHMGRTGHYEDRDDLMEEIEALRRLMRQAVDEIDSADSTLCGHDHLETCNCDRCAARRLLSKAISLFKPVMGAK